MKTHLECRQACITNPVIRLNSNKIPTVKDLLLSATSIGANVSSSEISKAIDELIDLEYPLINRILEVAAFLCANRRLYIYCANANEFESLKISSHNAGF